VHEFFAYCCVPLTKSIHISHLFLFSPSTFDCDTFLIIFPTQGEGFTILSEADARRFTAQVESEFKQEEVVAAAQPPVLEDEEDEEAAPPAAMAD
jgi:hypothetical protein